MLDNAQHLHASSIVLSTLNARYIHSAFGLRYLKANLGELEPYCVIEEFTLDSRPEDVVETLLQHQPKIIGFGVYIWNTVQTYNVVALIKAVAPDVVVVLGGPEVSYEYEDQAIVQLADYLIIGWGDISFRKLVQGFVNNDSHQLSEKIINGQQAPLKELVMPYHLYSEDDIKNRVLYVEASRGCPFKCEFCLSALDKTAWPFDLDEFLQHMDSLYQRGARHFKFVDRTFNLKINNSLRIMEFFLERMTPDLFLHFEVIPDHLPDALKAMIQRFPAGQLQFEIGIQTFNQAVQSRISRKQNNEKSKANLTWIREQSHAHIHADLIFGLPGETKESFADSFNQLVALRPHEIQVGILKRLKGSTIIRHTEKHNLVFNPNPPFSIVSSDTVSYQDVQFMSRFARFWDLIGNSGRFKHSLKLLLGKDPFSAFSVLSQGVFAASGQTHKISLLRLYDLVFQVAITQLGINAQELQNCLESDHQQSGLKSYPKFLNESSISIHKNHPNTNTHRANQRQERH